MSFLLSGFDGSRKAVTPLLAKPLTLFLLFVIEIVFFLHMQPSHTCKLFMQQKFLLAYPEKHYGCWQFLL